MQMNIPYDLGSKIKQAITKMSYTQKPDEFILDAINERLQRLKKSNYR